MSTSAHGSQDRRNDNGTEDPNKTIEFLRARLLSERSVSRAARQRADELAKRVAELEEQLKIISLQRKKAEKATAHVLSILENHGISDGSEEFDSSSDQDEAFFASNNGNDLGNGEETTTSVRVADTLAYSSSEIESSPSTGRSLSWKNSGHSLNSFEQKKYRDSTRRKFTSSTPKGSSPKCVGKSCRRVRRKEMRSTAEGMQKDSSILHGDVSTACSVGLPNGHDIQPSVQEEGPCHHEVTDPVSGESPSQSQVADHLPDGDEVYGNMEGALKHQEQLIGRYELEEKAQREWEEKFETNNCHSPELYDPGNHSDVTEERDEAKTTGKPCSTLVSNALFQDGESDQADISFHEDKPRTNSLVQQSVDISLHEGERSNKITQESLCPDSGSSESTEIHSQAQLENNNVSTPRCTRFSVSSSHVGNGSNNSSSSRNGTQISPIPHGTVDNVGSVLEALHQAKFSLNQKLDGSPSGESRSSGLSIESFVPATKTGDKMAIPAAFPGLFRLPIDLPYEKNSMYLGGSTSQLSLASYHPDAADRFYSSRYMDPVSSTSAAEQFHSISTSSLGSSSGTHAKNLALEPITAAGLSSSKGFTGINLQGTNAGHPFTQLRYPSYPLYPDITPQLHFNGGFNNTDVRVYPASRSSLQDGHGISLPQQTRSSISSGLPPSTQPFPYDHVRPNLYR